jgi:pSer/pThr/pTyr-binding forkhead associated (FHA) protein
METYLEFAGPDRILRRIEVDGNRLSIGSAPSNDLVIEGDGDVSRLHAALERFPAGWVIRDLASTNGTFVNGERIWIDKPLKPEDEILVGETRLVFKEPSSVKLESTHRRERPPDLTRRELDVLLELCRPALSTDTFRESASIREIAKSLFVTEAAVKQHLRHLYDKFGIQEGEHQRRRVALANEAMRRGVVTVVQLRVKEDQGLANDTGTSRTYTSAFPSR